jgi:sortase A
LLRPTRAQVAAAAGSPYPETVDTPSAPDASTALQPGSPVVATDGVESRGGAHRLKRVIRFVGTALIVLGVGAVAWTIVVWRWQDPFTALYTLYQQHKLAGRYRKIDAAYRPLLAQPSQVALARKRARAGTNDVSALELAVERRLVALDAKRYRQTLEPGSPLGRIEVPRLGLSSVLVTGTDHDSLTKGPGWYTGTYLPGQGQLMYIAGHRTTYLAPFAHIDRLRPGDLVTIKVPYGTFVYRVRSHRIVPADDLSQLETHNREVVALQACHPRFFATHRYIVYAVPVRVVPKGGKPYTVG